VDDETKAVLDKGAKLTEMLIQPQGKPYSPEEEILEIYITNHGAFQDIPVKEVRCELDRLMTEIRTLHPEVIDSISSEGKLSEVTKATLDTMIEAYKEKQ